MCVGQGLCEEMGGGRRCENDEELRRLRLKSESLDRRAPWGNFPMMLSAKQGRDDMTGEPRGVYRTLGTDEKPNTALVEARTLGWEHAKSWGSSCCKAR